MSSKTPPAVPPRPARSPNPASGPPKIPPRPSRRPGRSSPPKSDRYAPSPLNDPPQPVDLSSVVSHETNLPSQPDSPPSVNIPSPGEEGRKHEILEYQNNGGDGENQSQVQEPEETRSVNHGLYLHAPKPSLPSLSAEQQVRAVTHTTAQQAAAAGIGTTETPEPTESDRAYAKEPSADRPRENPKDEHDIPEFGQRAPLDPSTGDVQAPTRQHDTSKSQRETLFNATDRDPGSHGLHGHGLHPSDRFEKAWYEHHPEELVREEGGLLSSPRPEGAMSSDELNMMVQSSGDKGTGLGTSSEFLGTPEEEVGNIATEELAARLSSPPVGTHLRDVSKSHPSPLHQTSFPETVSTKDRVSGEEKPAGDAVHEEVEIHVNEPLHHQDHPDGFAPGLDEHDQRGADESQECPNDSPILAAVEVAPGREHMEPVVSPKLESSTGPEGQKWPENSAGSRQRHEPFSPEPGPEGGKRDEDRPKDVEEYAPLFLEGSKESQPPEDHLKQPPSHQQHRFPSKDVWEDAPESLQLETTVMTPDVPRRPKGENVSGASKEDIDPSKLVKRKSSEVTPNSLQLKTTVQELEEENQEEKLTSPEVERKPSIPAIPPRPSKSTTSPSPSESLEAEPEQKPEEKVTSPEIERKPSIPVIPLRPSKSTALPSSPERVEAEFKAAKQEAQVASPEIERKPSIPIIPPRPSKSTTSPSPTESVQERVTSPTIEPRKPPAIPERPKPQVPARPLRPKSRGLNATLTKTTSAGSVESIEEAPKPKPEAPSRPARPASNKIASLQAGFLSDLNNRLKLGPKPPPQQEKEELEKPVQKGPLSDARKGRARGPARRRPAATQAAPKPTPPAAPATPQIKLVDAWSAWHVGEDGVLVVGEKAPKSPERPAAKVVDEVPLSVAASEILERNRASEQTPEKSPQKTPEETPAETPEPAQPDTSEEEPKEEANVPSIAEGTQALNYPTPSPKTLPPPLLSNVDVPNDLSLEAQVKHESKPEAEVETKPERQLKTGSERETELQPKVMSEPEPKQEPTPVREAKEDEPQEKPPSEEEMIALLSPQEAIKKASQVVAEGGLDPRKSLSTEEKAAQMFP